MADSGFLTLPDPVPGVLADGTAVRFVPVTPAARERLRQGFESSSPESIYRRFLSPVSHLSEEQLDYLTNVDFADHVAWGAELTETGLGIAVGRWIRLRDEPDAAEAAVAVLDAYQGRGLGRALLWLLAGCAIDRGVRRFRAEVLEENEPMLKLLESLGAEIVGRSEAVLDVAVALPATIDELDRTPAPAILRAAAAGRFHLHLDDAGRLRFTTPAAEGGRAPGAS